MLIDLLLFGALTVTTVSAQQQYTANFSTTSYNCGITDCPPKSYPYYAALYYENIADRFQSETGSGNCWEV